MMTNNISAYRTSDRVRDIIEENNSLLVVLNRFDISLGFGDKTVEQLCESNGVDCDTFLAVLNYIGGRPWKQFEISIPALLNYLRRSHIHFIEYALPNIKKTLIEGIHEVKTSETGMLILKFYDDYVEEVKKHMNYEDDVVFNYVERLLDGKLEGRFHIADFSDHHEHVAGKLEDLKELFLYRYTQQNNEMINTSLMRIMTCGKELVSHCEIENLMLFPKVEQLERTLLDTSESDESQSSKSVAKTDLLTEREKDIIRGVALGLVNKEIADKLNLSFHTVTTYRKNIASKLNIHSTAGLVIFAILHKIVRMDEINIPL